MVRGVLVLLVVLAWALVGAIPLGTVGDVEAGAGTVWWDGFEELVGEEGEIDGCVVPTQLGELLGLSVEFDAVVFMADWLLLAVCGVTGALVVFTLCSEP